MIKIASIIALAAASAGVVLSNPVPDGHKPVIIGVPIINTTGVDSTIIRPRDDPNFLDYVSCYTLPEGNCHLVLVLAENNQNMGGLVINNICDQVISVAHSIHWGSRTTFARSSLPGRLVVEPHKNQTSIFWYNGQRWQENTSVGFQFDLNILVKPPQY
ncbi:hypothetical protein OOU_Y34scaffold00707g72 [Pyricularia oryzae Y34]|uniref:Uncharacterized protein n=3 Tax=Pyricularia oryzae TaxID=318829 RepID=A0A4P7N432_PYROR|nr:hypothetical protein OOU_Y34scaffold00707g72 [Pyricularia oryzae Y34]QBZ57123.1 hypothetical protein PoMZ_02045 [Pyricularia oryzae]